MKIECLCRTCENKKCIASKCDYSCDDNSETCEVTIDGYTFSCSEYRKE